MAAAYVSASVAQVADAANYTPGAGTDKVLIAASGSRGGNVDTSISSATYDGNACTVVHNNWIDIGGAQDPAGGFAYRVAPGASSATWDATYSGTTTGETAAIATIEGVDQTTPVYPTNGSAIATFSGVTTPSGLTYDVPDGGIVLYWSVGSADTTFTPPSGFTTIADYDVPSGSPTRPLVLCYREYVTGTTGASAAGTWGVSSWGVHGVVVFQPTAGGSIIPRLSLSGMADYGANSLDGLIV